MAFGGISISATGNVYPCNRIADVHSSGNVKTKKLAEIIPYLERMESVTNVDSITPCKECDLRYVCGGGCRIDDYCITEQSGHKVSFRDSNISCDNRIEKIICTDDCKVSILNKMLDVQGYMFTVNE